jgi:chemotaxis protein histidine kinase CheA
MLGYQEQGKEKESSKKTSSDTNEVKSEQTVNVCPNCGANTVHGADICEVCHTWLLNGKCKFCYSYMAPDASFCPECGNSKDGIQCPHCGRLSIFDFCTFCQKPLTEGAQEAIELAKTDPDAKEILDAVEEAARIEIELADINVLVKSEQEVDPVKYEKHLRQIEADAEKEAKNISKRLEKANKEAEIAAQKEALGIAKNLSEQEKHKLVQEAKAKQEALELVKKQEEEKRTQEIARKQEEVKTQAAIRDAAAKKAALEKQKQAAIAAAAAAQKKLQNKHFANNQDARRFHHAVKPAHPRGWRCNAYNVLHPDGPNGCAAPSRGGHWE